MCHISRLSLTQKRVFDGMPTHYRKALLDHIEEAPQTTKATQELFDNWAARLDAVQGICQLAEVETITTTVIDEATRTAERDRTRRAESLTRALSR